MVDTTGAGDAFVGALAGQLVPGTSLREATAAAVAGGKSVGDIGRGPLMSDLPEHVRKNRAYWDGMADQWVAPGRRNWQQDEPHWGIWQIPE